jgi:crotonobetainyl-CoA:carnitine CoA-transferase CaiB-like acyl-CoA transferase
MVDGLLSGFRALDLTDEKGVVCGKILAALGVDTIKVEKPGGDSARGIPPFLHDTPDPEKSLYWLAFNTDKRSITLNLETSKGRDLFRKLVDTADFVLESFPPGHMDSLGLGYEALRRINPRIILISITPFGQKGPYAHYKGCELIASAMSGVMATNGDPDRPPVREGPDSIYFESNTAAALGAVIAHYHRENTGEGQQVDISLQDVAAKRTTTNMVVWEFDKLLIKRNGTVRTFGARSTHWIWRCRDGYVFWSYMGGKFGAPANRALSQWIDEDGLENPLKQVANWDEFDMSSIPQEVLDTHQKAIGAFFMNHTKKEIAEEGLKRGINACVVNNPADVLENTHLKARDYWVGLEHPEFNMTLAYPRYFLLSNKTENFVRRRAPYIGEDNNNIYGSELGLSSVEISALEKRGVI